MPRPARLQQAQAPGWVEQLSARAAAKESAGAGWVAKSFSATGLVGLSGLVVVGDCASIGETAAADAPTRKPRRVIESKLTCASVKDCERIQEDSLSRCEHEHPDQEHP